MGSPFLKLFGKSPFRPLFQHMETSYLCVTQLQEFFVSTQASDWAKAAEVQQQINILEHKADDLKRSLRLNLPRDLFMPVARTDILWLVAEQDLLANESKHIAGLVMGRKMQIPEAIKEQYFQFLARSIDAARQAFKAIRELNDLYDAGFSGREVEIIRDMIEELHHIEHDTDEMQIKLRATLFAHETEIPPVEVIFLYKLIEWTGRLADIAQRIGDRLQISITR